MPTVTIEPNEKYRYVVDGVTPPSSAETTPATRVNYAEQRDAFRDIAEAPDAPSEVTHRETLSWSHISPPSDPDLLDMMATYFIGVESTDPSELIQAKLRIADVDHVANAQIAAREELDD